jgi:hypothetical protein
MLFFQCPRLCKVARIIGEKLRHRSEGPVLHPKLRDATDAAISTPEIQERLKKIGADVVPLEHRSQDYLAKFVENEITKWAVMIKAAGLTAE